MHYKIDARDWSTLTLGCRRGPCRPRRHDLSGSRSSTCSSPQHRPEFDVPVNVARAGSAPFRIAMAGRPRAEGAPRPMCCEVWASPARSSAAKGPKTG